MKETVLKTLWRSVNHRSLPEFDEVRKIYAREGFCLFIFSCHGFLHLSLL